MKSSAKAESKISVEWTVELEVCTTMLSTCVRRKAPYNRIYGLVHLFVMFSLEPFWTEVSVSMSRKPRSSFCFYIFVCILSVIGLFLQMDLLGLCSMRVFIEVSV